MLESSLIFLSFAALYVAAAAPSVTFGDSGEFAACAAVWGLPHAPGYPLYTAAARAAGEIFALGNWAYRTNLFSALAAAGALAILADALRRAGAAGPARWTAVALLGFSPLFAGQGCVTEVFAPHLLLLSALFWLACRFSGKLFEDRPMAAFGLLCGLALGNHQTFALAAPAVLLEGWRSARPSPARLARGLIVAAGFFALGLAVYLCLPLRSVHSPPLDWGHPTDLPRFLHVFLRKDYGSLSLTVEGRQGGGASAAAAQVGRFLRASAAGLGWWTLALAAAGALVWTSAGLSVGLSLPLVWIFLTGPFFLWLGNPPFDAQTSGALDRFFLAPGVAAAVLAAGALHWLCLKTRAWCWAVPAAAVLAAARAASAAPAWCARADFAAYDYGRGILKSLPPRSVLFMDGGDDTFYSLAFLSFAQRRRPDVELHDRGGLVFRSVYGPDFRALAPQAKEDRRLEAEGSWAREDRLFYSTFRERLVAGYALAPWGLLKKAQPEGGAAPAADFWELYPRRWNEDALAARYRDRALIAVYPVMRAIDLDARGRAGEAVEQLRTAWLLGPDVLWLKGNAAFLLGGLGFKASQKGDWALAEKALSLANRVDPESAEGLLNLGVVYEKTGRLREAERIYRDAARLDPKSARAEFNLGALFWGQERWREAAEAFENASRLAPQDQAMMRWAVQARRRSGS